MIAVIGDIHGCYYSLKELVEKVRDTYGMIQIYTVGDLVDRGNFSVQVIEYIRAQNILFTKGNHDVMFYLFVLEPKHPLSGVWKYNGGRETLAEYGDDNVLLREHAGFLNDAPLFFNLDDCFISHAGVSRNYGRSLIEQDKIQFENFDEFFSLRLHDDDGIIWNRSELLDLGKLQVVGHTRKLNILYQNKNNAVYIDTSASTGNTLSAIIIEEGEITDTIAVQTNSTDIRSVF